MDHRIFKFKYKVHSIFWQQSKMKLSVVVGEMELLVVELGDEVGVEVGVEVEVEPVLELGVAFCPSETPGVLSSSVMNSFNGLKFHLNDGTVFC